MRSTRVTALEAENYKQELQASLLRDIFRPYPPTFVNNHLQAAAAARRRSRCAPARADRRPAPRDS